MNILFDHQVFNTQKFGGVSRIFYELIRRLAEKPDLNLAFFHGFHINEFPLANIKNKIPYYYGKKSIYFPHVPLLLKPLNNISFKFFLNFAANGRRGQEIDIYHPTGYSPIVYRWKKCPVVLHVNDMIPELFPQDFRDIKSRLKTKKKCIRRADMIITISHHTRQDLVDYYGVPGEKVKVIYPGAPVPVEPAPENKPNTALPPANPFILYVGTRKQGYKNFKNLILAYSSAKKINREYKLVCFGGPPFNRAERQMLTQLGSLDQVLHRSGDDRCLAAFYRGAAAFVYPSLYEGFGLPPLEAMTYGCPVIAANVSVIPEVLGNAAAYFDPDKPESMADELESILCEENSASQLVKKGFEQIKQYSWQKMSDEIYHAYHQLKGS